MQIKLIVSAAAIALAATIGPASADEQFSSLEGIPAVPMSPEEQAAVVGAMGPGAFIPPNGGFTSVRNLDANPSGSLPWVPINPGTGIADGHT